MSKARDDIVIKILALALAIGAVIWMADNLKTGDGFWKAFVVGGGLVAIGTAIGFARYRGWAFMLVSVGLLVSFFFTFVRFVVAFDSASPDGPGDPGARVIPVLIVIGLIGYLGRWSMERRFRPHLDIDHH